MPFSVAGLPDITTGSGAHVLAHELAHVVQPCDNTAVGRIRRKIGFEFEVGEPLWTLERLQSWKTSLSGRETSGQDMLLRDDSIPGRYERPHQDLGEAQVDG